MRHDWLCSRWFGFFKPAALWKWRTWGNNVMINSYRGCLCFLSKHVNTFCRHQPCELKYLNIQKSLGFRVSLQVVSESTHRSKGFFPLSNVLHLDLRYTWAEENKDLPVCILNHPYHACKKKEIYGAVTATEDVDVSTFLHVSSSSLPKRNSTLNLLLTVGRFCVH